LSTLLAATFIGGTGPDEGHGLAVTSDGVYLVGTTAAPDFPATPGALDDSANGEEDAFVAKLGLDLSALAVATYLGGTDEDRGLAVALDGAEVVVAGFTDSADFPFSAGAFGTDPGPRGGPFVARLDAHLALLHAATALGDEATVNALAVDATSGDVVIAGHVTGEDYPATPGAFDEACGADDRCDLWGPPEASHRKGDGFVSRLD